MADQPKSDMVMQFFPKGSKEAVLAEGVIQIDPKDTLMTTFNTAAYDDYSNYFEVTKFEFAVEVKDEDSSKGNVNKAGTAIPGKHGADPKARKAAGGMYQSWRSATDQDIAQYKVRYPLEFDTFSFTRLVDAASPLFFDYCLRSQSFDKAILVKRVSIGGNQASQGFLQVLFRDVLITKLGWDDGDLVTEEVEFICRGLDIRYKQQSFSGSLQAEKPVSWDASKDALPKGAQGRGS